jgi:hypothetical protein
MLALLAAQNLVSIACFAPKMLSFLAAHRPTF